MSSFRTSGRDIFEIVLSEHEITRLTVELINHKYSQSRTMKSLSMNKEIITLIYSFIRDLAMHAHKEMIVLYPLFDRIKNDENAKQIANNNNGGQDNDNNKNDISHAYDHALKETMETEQKLLEIEQLTMKFETEQFNNNVTNPLEVPIDIINLINNLASEVIHHINDEEKRLIPILKLAMNNNEESIELGRKWESLNGNIGTRPHPDAPTKGELCLAANNAVALSDKQIDEARFGHSTSTGPGKVTSSMTDLNPKEIINNLSNPLQQPFVKEFVTNNTDFDKGNINQQDNSTAMKDELM